MMPPKAQTSKPQLTLNDLIEKYHAAQRAWLEKSELDDSDENTRVEWDHLEAAQDAVIGFPCQNIDDVRTKAAFVLSDESSMDSLRTCFLPANDKRVWLLTSFLQSLLGEPVDIGEKP